MNNPSFPTPIGAVLLCGGRSSRMGRPKALLPFAGEPLVVHLVRRLATLFFPVVVVAAKDQELPTLEAEIVRDSVPEAGPLQGLFDGLQSLDSIVDTAFVMACDMPLLTVEAMRTFTKQAIELSDMGIAAIVRELNEPFPAIYGVSAVLDVIKMQLECGERSFHRMLSKLNVGSVGEMSNISFFNMNTPDDYRAALQLFDLRITDSCSDIDSQPS